MILFARTIRWSINTEQYFNEWHDKHKFYHINKQTPIVGMTIGQGGAGPGISLKGGGAGGGHPILRKINNYYEK